MQLINRNPSAASARYTFTWKYVLGAELPVLNVGCADDPVHLENYAVHFDYDDFRDLYASRGQKFVQGDAHHLPFEDGTFHTVICADVLEHAVEPQRMFLECCRVARKHAVFTVFEEWRLPGHGQHIEYGNWHRDQEAKRYGFATADEHAASAIEGYKKVEGISHLAHINQFSDADIFGFVHAATAWQNMRVREYRRAEEAVYDGHQWSNWLICLERMEVQSAGKVSEELEAVSRSAPQRIQQE